MGGGGGLERKSQRGRWMEEGRQCRVDGETEEGLDERVNEDKGRGEVELQETGCGRQGK